MRIVKRFILEKRALQYLISLLLLGSFFQACDTDQELVDPIPQHKDYVNLSTGSVRVYEVDSFFYNKFQKTIDTFQYIVRETVGEEIDSNRYRMQRQMDSTSENIKADPSLYSAKMKKSQYEVFRNNQRLVKMTFPVKAGKSWNGNAFNNLLAADFRYKNVHQPYSNKHYDFDSTVTVVEKDSGNRIEQKTRKVVYAKDVGMVYKEELNLRFEGETLPPKDTAWEKKANKGYIIRYKLKNYWLP